MFNSSTLVFLSTEWLGKLCRRAANLILEKALCFDSSSTFIFLHLIVLHPSFSTMSEGTIPTFKLVLGAFAGS